MNNLEEIGRRTNPALTGSRATRAGCPSRSPVRRCTSFSALVLIFIALTIVGTPGGHVFTEPPLPREAIIGEITPGSAAAAANLQRGDKIVAVDGESISDFSRLHDVLVARGGQSVTLEFERGGQRLSATTTLGPLDPNKGVLGVRQQGSPRSGSIRSMQSDRRAARSHC